MRYVINYGKFGAYIYDTQEDKDLTLREVRDMLNQFDKLSFIEKVEGWKKK